MRTIHLFTIGGLALGCIAGCKRSERDADSGIAVHAGRQPVALAGPAAPSSEAEEMQRRADLMVEMIQLRARIGYLQDGIQQIGEAEQEVRLGFQPGLKGFLSQEQEAWQLRSLRGLRERFSRDLRLAEERLVRVQNLFIQNGGLVYGTSAWALPGQTIKEDAPRMGAEVSLLGTRAIGLEY